MSRPVQCSQHLGPAALVAPECQGRDHGPSSTTAHALMVQHNHADVAAQAAIY